MIESNRSLPLSLGRTNERLDDLAVAEDCEEESPFSETGVTGRLECVVAGEGSVELADLAASY